MEITSSIDAAFLDSAEEEIFQILLFQHLSYSDRWDNSYLSIKVAPYIRRFGLGLSSVGVAMSLYVIWRSPAWCPAWIDIYYYLVIFIVCIFIFYFLPQINKALYIWNRNYAPKNCRKLAAKYVKTARERAPYIAKYIIEDGSISYYRVSDNSSDFAWKRKLKGVAFSGKYATLIFKKKTSFISKIVLLHEEAEVISTALKELSVKTCPMQIYKN